MSKRQVQIIWVDHLRNTVKFAENIETVTRDKNCVLVEIGPGKTLTNLARANLEIGSAVLSSMRHPNENEADTVVAKRTLGAMWAKGVELDWAEYWRDEYRFRVGLPTYSFEKKVHWVAALDKPPAYEELELRKKKDIADWFAKLAWRQSDLATEALDQEADYLVFANESELCKQLAKGIETSGASCITAAVGSGFAETARNHYQFSPDDEKAFFMLSEQRLDSATKPLKIFYCWTLLDANQVAADAQKSVVTDRCFWGLFNLLKVLAELDRTVELCVVADRLHSLTDEPIVPEVSLALGPVLVAPRELPHVSARIIDVRAEHGKETLCAKQLLKELSYRADFSQVLYRGRYRWVRDIEPVSVESRPAQEQWLPESATVLISGGLGGIGLNIADLLSHKHAKKIVLMSRRDVPDPSTWDKLLGQLAENNPLHYQLSALKTLKQSGSEIVTLAADVTNVQSMTQAFAEAGLPIDSVDVVIHAAGMMDDKLLIEKTNEEAEKVLAAKVGGAKALDQLFAGVELERFIVFSSVASYLGLPGQIDYTSANAFLDAFVVERSERCAGKSLAINWSAWKDVGMAANVGKKSDVGLPVESSLLDTCVKVGSEGAILFC